MTKQASTKELRAMTFEDLIREARMLRDQLAKLRLAVQLSKEKDTATYRRDKKHLARMETILTEKRTSLSSPKK